MNTDTIRNIVAQLAGSAAVHGADHDFIRQHTEAIDASLTALQEERERMRAALKSGVSEECEGCGDPATHYDCEMVPLCDACWEELLRDSAADAATDEGQGD